jgi:ring-1,2-phenylacetyl-CoA epoxidase subunit PaaD
MSNLTDILDTVYDPEIPVLTIRDLGILRHAVEHPDGSVEVTITPTYSGCPAMRTIEVNLKAALQEAGYERVQVHTVLSPAWTTEWLTPEGHQKLRAYGIAPPEDASRDKRALTGERRILSCPQCGSQNTQMLAEFASTSCKAMFRCLDCLEPFDYFKCH